MVFAAPLSRAAETAAGRPARRVVLCLDGTWNSAFEEHRRRDGHTVLKPTNPLKLCRAVVPFDEATGRVQLTYYDIGVGALAEYPGTSNRMLRFFDRTLGGAWGAGFEGRVEDALSFLVLNYEPDDEVFLFGFSRGAAQARAVAGFLDWSGGLPEKDDAYYLPVLFRHFVVTRGRGSAQDEIARINGDRAKERPARRPLKPFRPVGVTYLGVWDTVMALGSRFEAVHDRTSVAGRSFYVTDLPPACVTHARQALAVDEARFDFRPEIWHGRLPGQRMEQRWFPGVHSNVGGAYGNDGLANTALRWIVEGAVEHRLALDQEFLKAYRPFFGDTLYESYGRFYRILDQLRGRAKKGRRRVDLAPDANATIDPSVIHRMQADPGILQPNANGTPAGPYRPRNVIEFLAALDDLAGYLSAMGITGPLPEDVMRRIEQLRRETPKAPRAAASAQARQ